MKFNIDHTYETCIYSLKRKNAPWRVKEGCDNRFCLFTGKHYELPNHTICMSCPNYVRDKQFEICRLYDKDRHNSVGLRFVSELIDQLLQQGRMVTAETDYGPGIRTATAKEMGSCRQQPKEQLDGQISMMF